MNNPEVIKTENAPKAIGPYSQAINIFGLTFTSGQIPLEFGNLINLNSLRLFSNKLSGQIPMEIGNLTELEFLYLHDNFFIDNQPENLEKLTKIKYINLDNKVVKD